MTAVYSRLLESFETHLIDNALFNRDITRLNWLALGMIGVWQRYLSANIGESLITDLRNELFQHMQRMSLRFFTRTKPFVIYTHTLSVFDFDTIIAVSKLL